MTADDRKPPRRGLSEDDRALWSAVARSVSPLPRKPARTAAAPSGDAARKTRLPPSKAPSAGIVRPAPAPKPSALPLMPIDRRLKQRLARGVESIDARIDLHGKTQSEAHGALLRFLRRAQAEGAKVVLVITGKGARASDVTSPSPASGGGSGRGHGERGVLKRQVPLWLTLPEFRAYVLGVDAAHVGHGGEGALYVRVRRAR